MSINNIDSYKVSHVFDTDVKMTKTAGQVLYEASIDDCDCPGWEIKRRQPMPWPGLCATDRDHQEHVARAVIEWHEAQMSRREGGWQALIEQIEDEVLPPASERPRHEIGGCVLDAIRDLKWRTRCSRVANRSPISESMGPWAMIRLRDRDELGPRPVRIKIRRDARPMWEDLLTGEWYSEAEIQGWWRLPVIEDPFNKCHVSGANHSLAIFYIDNHYTGNVEGPFTFKQLLTTVPNLRDHDAIDILVNGQVIAEFIDGEIKE